MELLIALLISFGAVSSNDARTLSNEDAVRIAEQSNVDGRIIWGAEADDF